MRHLQTTLKQTLLEFPVAALLGPRQVGKTTLALALAADFEKEVEVLDLERDSDRARLADAETYLGSKRGKLTILDEVQRVPELFPLLRSLVDERVRAGESAGHFLVLGSASRDLLRQSSESLAGRISYHELTPFGTRELQDRPDPVDGPPPATLPDPVLSKLWLRGSFPRSYLAANDRTSWHWRGEFISTYLERDIPQLGPRIPAERLRTFWSMLAHGQGDLLNAARLASGLGVTGKTIRHYLDVLTDLYMVRQLRPWTGNLKKRLVKSPKIYVRDSGLLHRLANIPDEETLLGHPLCGPSFEGFVLEQILACLPDTYQASFYRSTRGAEIDLVLSGPGPRTIAVEIKRTSSPRVGRGFTSGCEDVRADERYFVVPIHDSFPMGNGVHAIGLSGLLARL